MIKMIKRANCRVVFWGMLCAIILVLVGLWFFLAYFRFDYKRRVFIDNLLDKIATKVYPFPAWLLPYPRYEVVNDDDHYYFYAFVGGFENVVEKGEIAADTKRVVSSRAILHTLYGKEEKVDVYDTSIKFSYLVNGSGLFLRSSNFEGTSFIQAEGLRFNIRSGDFVKVSVGESGEETITWFASRKFFY